MQQLTLTDISPDDNVADSHDAPDEPKYRDEEWLREQYVEKGRTQTDIGDECGCSPTTVRRWMKRNGIERRKGGSVVADSRLKNEQWLRQKYVADGLTQSEIADLCDTTPTTVSNWISKHNIEHSHGCHQGEVPGKEWFERRYHEEGATQYDIAEELGVSQRFVYEKFKEFEIKARDRHAMQGISMNSPLRDESWLREMYVQKKKSMNKIADMLGVTDYCVNTFLSKHNIQTRDVVGKNHPQWRGGSWEYGAGWNDSKRRAVRERDDHTCQDPACSVTQEDHHDRYNEKLHVHHLIKARDIDDPEERNAMGNLITLCRDCHRKWEQLSEMGIRPEITGVTAD